MPVLLMIEQSVKIAQIPPAMLVMIPVRIVMQIRHTEFEKKHVEVVHQNVHCGVITIGFDLCAQMMMMHIEINVLLNYGSSRDILLKISKSIAL